MKKNSRGILLIPCESLSSNGNAGRKKRGEERDW